MGLLSNVIGAISPRWEASRADARTNIALAEARTNLLKFTADASLTEEQNTQLAADNNGNLGSNYGPYTGAQSDRTSVGWFASPKSPQFRYGSLAAMRSMRDRARGIEINNVLGEALLSRCVENVVGPKGLQCKPAANNPAWTPEKNAEWNAQAKALIDRWFPTADIGGMGWVEHQRAVFRSMLRDGDVGVILTADGNLQGIEADLIANPQNSQDTAGKNIIFGVEVDQLSNPLAFWVTPIAVGPDVPKSTRIDAKDFILLKNPTRFSQIRGITIYSTVFKLLDQISTWVEATVMAARIAACFGVAITRNDNSPVYKAGNTTTNKAGQTQTQINLEPGAIQNLKTGETITTIDPANPGQDFPANLTALVRLAGLPFGLPLELALLDFSKTSYASARSSMLQAYRKFQQWQRQFIDTYLSRVYFWRISKFIKAGLLEANPDAKNHHWIATPWPFLDPVKEYQAIQMSLDTGMENLTDLLLSHGKEFVSHTDARAAEIKTLTDKGIPMLHSQSMMQYVDPSTAMQQGSSTNKPDKPPVSNPDDQIDPLDGNE